MTGPGTLGRQRDAAHEVDPREHEPWFLALPEQGKEDFRKRWAAARRDDEIKRLRAQDQLIQCLIEGVVTYALVELLVYGLGLWSLVVTFAVGALVGFLWHTWQCGRATAALVGIVAFWGVRMASGIGSPLSALIALILVTCLSMAMAIPREAGRFGARGPNRRLLPVTPATPSPARRASCGSR